MLVLGAISGTSMDGIDVALLETDGEGAGSALAGRTCPYDLGLRAALLDLAADPARAEHRDLTAIEAAVTLAHVGAARALLAETAASVALAGFHGQTILHRPPSASIRASCSTAPWRRGSWASRSSRASAMPTWRPAGRARRWRRSTIERSRAICRAR